MPGDGLLVGNKVVLIRDKLLLPAAAVMATLGIELGFPMEIRQCSRRGDGKSTMGFSGQTRCPVLIKLVALLLSCVIASPSLADCNDRPGPGVDWSGCLKLNRQMANDDFRGANLVGSNFTKSNLSGTDFTGANLSNAILVRTKLSGANLSRADLSKAMLDRADLRGADLSSAHLSKAEFHRVDFTNAKLTGSLLEGAELGRAILVGADLSGANLQNAYLARANLSNALLKGANLRNTDLYLADLQGADLSLANGMTQDQLSKSCGDAKTKLPAGLIAPESWPCINGPGNEP